MLCTHGAIMLCTHSALHTLHQHHTLGLPNVVIVQYSIAMLILAVPSSSVKQTQVVIPHPFHLHKLYQSHSNLMHSCKGDLQLGITGCSYCSIQLQFKQAEWPGVCIIHSGKLQSFKASLRRCKVYIHTQVSLMEFVHRIWPVVQFPHIPCIPPLMITATCRISHDWVMDIQRS